MLCNCGCGGEVNPGRHFVRGHSQQSTGMTGKHHSWATRQKMSKAKGGTGTWIKYHPYVSWTELYEKIRPAVYRRDKNKCIQCRRTDAECRKEGRHGLDMHHVVPWQYKAAYLSRFCDHPSNLVTLCHRCHKRVTGNQHASQRDGWRKFLPFTYKYLRRFGYKTLLLRRYYRPGREDLQAKMKE